jgi:hypothetical protein
MRAFEMGRVVRMSKIEFTGACRDRARPARAVPTGLPAGVGGAHGRCVYFAQDTGDEGLVKIGSTEHLGFRLRSIELVIRRPLRLLLAFPGNYRVETAVHRLLADERVRGEWFRASPRVLDAIAFWDSHTFAAIAERTAA